MSSEHDYGEVAETWDDEDYSSEIDLQIAESTVGHRDFRLFRVTDGKRRAVDPLDLLGLDVAAHLIEQDKRCDSQPAMALALCRLLVPSIQQTRSGMHLKVSEWTTAAAQGNTLTTEVRVPVSADLARDQEALWQVVQANENPPEGSLEEIFWSAVTELPHLPREFQDGKLWKFASELYDHLIPEGDGLVRAHWPDVTRKVNDCRKGDFTQLGLGFKRRELQRLFRKLIAVTLRLTSKLTGRVVREIIREKSGEVSLTPNEEVLLNLRYGSAEQFGKINAGYLTACGPLFAEFFNNIFEAVANEESADIQTAASNNLFKFVYLHSRYQEFRKYAWQEEKSERRGRSAGKRPLFETEIVDHKAAAPDRQAIASEELQVLRNEILSELERTKPEYAFYTRLFIEHGADFESAAEESGLSVVQYKRRMKETVLPAVQSLEKRMRQQTGNE